MIALLSRRRGVLGVLFGWGGVEEGDEIWRIGNGEMDGECVLTSF